MTRQGSPSTRPPRQLGALFDPRAIAVVGASDDPAKWGHILARRALESGTPSPVALVNRRGGQVLGRPAYPSLAEARDGAGAGARARRRLRARRSRWSRPCATPSRPARGAIVAITAGLAELGAEGAAVEAEAVAVARAGGAVLVGPNCLGVADTGAGLQLGHALLPPGEVTVLSQSGNLVLDLAPLLAAARHWGSPGSSRWATRPT